MTNYTVDVKNQDSTNLLSIAVREKISHLNTEYWTLHGPDATALQLDRITVQIAEYRVLAAQLDVSYQINNQKAWSELGDGSAVDKADAAVRRAQIAKCKAIVDRDSTTLNEAKEKCTKSRKAERDARNAA